MADLPESIEWAPGVYQLETSDPVLGGPEGIDNLQAKQLANRTQWLKDQIDKVINGVTAIGKAVQLATARTFTLSGAATGSASFDGSANANIVVTLANSGVAAGTYPKVQVSAKGLVTGGAALNALDIPDLDWSKITTGQPNTLDGYGITLPTQAQAEAGTDNALPMTPLLVFKAIAKVVVQATEAAFGWAKVATQAQTNAGTDDATVVTPKKLRMGVAMNLAATGYICMPTWLGGWMVQWGEGLYATDTAVTYPIAFTNNAFKVLICAQNFDNGQASPNKVKSMAAYALTKTGFTASSGSGIASNATWIAIGN